MKTKTNKRKKINEEKLKKFLTEEKTNLKKHDNNKHLNK